MDADPIVVVQTIAFLTHIAVAAVALHNRQVYQKSYELITSAASIGAILYALALFECLSGVCSTLSTFPMLVPVIVTPMLAADVANAIGMKRTLQLLFAMLVLICMLSIQLMYMIPEHYAIFAVTSTLSVAMLGIVFILQYRHSGSIYGRTSFSLSFLTISIPVLIQTYIPYILQRSMLAVLTLAPIISSVTISSVAILIFKVIAQTETKDTTVLHTIGHALKTSNSSQRRETSKIELVADKPRLSIIARKSILKVSSSSEGVEPTEQRLYSEGYTTDSGSEPGHDVTVTELDGPRESKRDRGHLGRLLPLSFELHSES